MKRGLVLILAAVAALVSACGGDDREPGSPDAVRESISAERDAEEQAAIDAEARALAGECTLTGPGSEFRRRGNEIIGGGDLPQNGAWLAWLTTQPEGCTDRDQRMLAAAIDGTESQIVRLGGAG